MRRRLPDDGEQQQGRDDQVADQDYGHIGWAVIGGVARERMAALPAGGRNLQVAPEQLALRAGRAAVACAPEDGADQRMDDLGHGAHMRPRARARKGLRAWTAGLADLFVRAMPLLGGGRARRVGVVADVALLGVLAVLAQDVRVLAGDGGPARGADAGVRLEVVA